LVRVELAQQRKKVIMVQIQLLALLLQLVVVHQIKMMTQALQIVVVLVVGVHLIVAAVAREAVTTEQLVQQIKVMQEAAVMVQVVEQITIAVAVVELGQLVLLHLKAIMVFMVKVAMESQLQLLVLL
jgi:hypothetical protein